MTRRPATVTAALRRGTVRALLVFVPFAAAFLIGQHVTLQAPVVAPHVTAAPTASDLIAAHDCWTGEAPVDVATPGHVVVTIDGAPTYGGTRLTGKALEQTFDGIDHGLTLHAFCR